MATPTVPSQFAVGKNRLIHKPTKATFLPALAADLVNCRHRFNRRPVGHRSRRSCHDHHSDRLSGQRCVLKTGVITSLARPRGNVTGVAMFTSALLSKCLQFLSELVPKEAAIGVLVNPDNSNPIEDKNACANSVGSMVVPSQSNIAGRREGANVHSTVMSAASRNRHKLETGGFSF